MDLNIRKNLTRRNFSQGGKDRIKYIVVHFTANDGDTAYGNTQYFKEIYRDSSAHYFVDETSIWQCVEDEDIAWHCGTSGAYYHKFCRNSNSLGIELCSRRDSAGKYYFKENTVKLAAMLVSYLMDKYKVPKENVIRHYDVTHKNCPAPFVEDIEKWNEFKESLNKKGDEENEMVEKTDIEINGKKYTINRILKDDKNYICLSDLKAAGFDVGYIPETKTPTLNNTVKELSVIANGESKTVKALNINGYNYCNLRDIADATESFTVSFEDGKVIAETINNADK